METQKICDLELDQDSKKLLALCGTLRDIYYLCGKLNKSYPYVMQRANILTSLGYLQKVKKLRDHKTYYILTSDYKL